MLDIKLIREKTQDVKDALAKRGADTSIINNVLVVDEKWRVKQAEVETLRAEQKKGSKGKPTPEDIARLKELSDKVKSLDVEAKELQEQQRQILLGIPNLPDENIVVGKSEADNKELRKWGEIPSFDFEPKAHDDLGVDLGILNFDEAAKLSGARFAVYHGLGAKLERALINFMLDTHTNDNSYEELIVPTLVNEKTMTGTGQLPKFKEDLFITQNEEFYLIPTAEVPVTNLKQDDILSVDELPKCYTAHTLCYRSEAGSYGKDTKGLIRQHQFNKVELVKLSKPEESDAELEKLTSDAEKILQLLKLPYRVVELCSGDIGFSARKTYDLEVWFPSQNCYREISSCSNFGDFQARRANIRFRRDANSKPEFVHTLNGSGLAVGRTWAAIMENYQQVDGSITIPEVLIPYMNKVDKIG